MNRPGPPTDTRRLPWWLYLALAHHSERRSGRTIPVRLLGWEQRLCTRCSFQWATFALVTVAAGFRQVEMGTVAWGVMLGLLPLAPLVDWITQTWGYRESTTRTRAVTGAMLGCGFSFQLLAAIDLDHTRVLLGVGIYFSYMAMIYVLFRIKPLPSSYAEDLVDAIRKARPR